MDNSVLLAMSGGVDSSAAAIILKNAGYNVVGVTYRLWCKSGNDDVKDAQLVCRKLGIEHRVLNLEEKFREKVVDNFVSEYLSARTPNPCVECNKYIKFSALTELADELGIKYIATGHYAVVDKENDEFVLKKAKFLNKDQSYFLYNLTQKELSRLLLPLGTYEKEEIRKIAGDNLLKNSEKPDSQDICFVPDGKYAEFISKYSDKSKQKGKMVDINGNFLKEFEGIENFTIGQRKGLGISLGRPAFVVEKNSKKNIVVIGEEKDLLKEEIKIKDVNFISDKKPCFPMEVLVKTRYKQKEQKALMESFENGILNIKLFEKQKAITPGQSAVFYFDDKVIGGGKII